MFLPLLSWISGKADCDDKDGVRAIATYMRCLCQPKNTLRGLDGVFHLVKDDEKTKAYLVLWTVVRIILQMGEISCFNEALLLPSSLHSHRAVCDIRPCICLREPSASTPMEQLFGGALRNEIRCFGCGENYVNYERIRELNLGLRMRKREGIVGINDLLVDYFSNETLSSFECKKFVSFYLMKTFFF